MKKNKHSNKQTNKPTPTHSPTHRRTNKQHNTPTNRQTKQTPQQTNNNKKQTFQNCLDSSPPLIIIIRIDSVEGKTRKSLTLCAKENRTFKYHYMDK